MPERRNTGKYAANSYDVVIEEKLYKVKLKIALALVLQGAGRSFSCSILWHAACEFASDNSHASSRLVGLWRLAAAAGLPPLGGGHADPTLEYRSKMLTGLIT